MTLPVLSTPTFELKLSTRKKPVKMRPFLVKEHKALMMLASADDSEVARVVSELVEICSFGEIKATAPYHEIVYAFTQLRAKSIGEEAELTIECGCGHKFPHTLNLSQTELVLDPTHDNKVLLDPENGIGVVMRYPRFEEITRALGNDGKVLDLVAKNIEAVYTADTVAYTEELTHDEMVAYVEGMTGEQIKRIEQFFKTCPVVRNTVNAVCPECKKEHKHTIEGLFLFFV